MVSKETLLLIDYDTKLPLKWKKDWLETRKAILDKLGLKYVECIIHQSKICRDCGKSRTDFLKNLKNYKICKFCGSKKLKYGRGVHCFMKVSGKALKPREVVKIEYLLGSDEHKQLLSLKKIDKGLPFFDKLFSQVIYRRPPSKHPKCKNCGYEIKICPKCKKEIKQGCLECGIRLGVQKVLNRKHF